MLEDSRVGGGHLDAGLFAVAPGAEEGGYIGQGLFGERVRAEASPQVRGCCRSASTQRQMSQARPVVRIVMLILPPPRWSNRPCTGAVSSRIDITP